MQRIDVDVKMLDYHVKQKHALSNKGKRNVLCAGRRAGKTIFFADYSAGQFLDGKRVVYGTPVNKQLKTYWGYVKKFLKPLIQAGFVHKNETDKTIKWAHEDSDGAMISAQTAYDADHWRGDYGDVLIFDEYAFMSPDVWEVVGFPMLLDTGGEAWFGSTPNRKNHFFYLYTRGNDPLENTWKSFHFTSHDNPHLNKEALEEMVADATEDIIRQEIMAEFLDNDGAVFRNIEACHNAPYTRSQDHKDHTLLAGIDWGKKKDYTVLSIGCLECAHEVSLTRFNKIDYTYQREKIKIDWDKWGVQWGLGESNAMGEPNIEALQDDLLDVEGFATTAASKPGLIQGLVLDLEREDFQFLNIPVARSEMEAYEMKISPNTQRPTYSAPAGVNDDTVIARALMRKAMTSYMPAFV